MTHSKTKKMFISLGLTVAVTLSATGNARAADSRNDSPSPVHLETISFLEELGFDTQDPAFSAGFEQAVETMEELSNYETISTRITTTPRSTDGCSYSPDRWGKANFKPVCDRHDICYSKSSKVSRKTCDTLFGVGFVAACKSAYTSGFHFKTCSAIAGGYVAAVRQFGKRYYKGQDLNN